MRKKNLFITQEKLFFNRTKTATGKQDYFILRRLSETY